MRKAGEMVVKAYQVYDRTGYFFCSVIVFAETSGKAKALALGTDEFPSDGWDFTDLGARRKPELDKHYRGNWLMDWYNDDDRLVLIKEAGYRCDDDSFDPDDCLRCVGKDYCERYEEYLEEDNEE